MNSKSILLAYATRFGSTQEVAEAITATLREAGIEVELQAMQDVESLDGYDTHLYLELLERAVAEVMLVFGEM